MTAKQFEVVRDTTHRDDGCKVVEATRTTCAGSLQFYKELACELLKLTSLGSKSTVHTIESTASSLRWEGGLQDLN